MMKSTVRVKMFIFSLNSIVFLQWINKTLLLTHFLNQFWYNKYFKKHSFFSLALLNNFKPSLLFSLLFLYCVLYSGKFWKKIFQISIIISAHFFTAEVLLRMYLLTPEYILHNIWWDSIIMSLQFLNQTVWIVFLGCIIMIYSKLKYC